MMHRDFIDFGDIIQIAGYGQRLFRVEGYSVTSVYEPGEPPFTDKIYDLTCLETGSFEIAFYEDVRRVCGADDAEEYLRNRNVTPSSGSDAGVAVAIPGKEDGGKKSPNNSIESKKKDNSRKIDELLEEYSDYKSLLDEFGDEEYTDRLKEITAQLVEITKEGGE